MGVSAVLLRFFSSKVVFSQVSALSVSVCKELARWSIFYGSHHILANLRHQLKDSVTTPIVFRILLDAITAAISATGAAFPLAFTVIRTIVAVFTLLANGIVVAGIVAVGMVSTIQIIAVC